MLTNTLASVVIAQAIAHHQMPMRENLEQVMCLAEAIYHEARGKEEPLAGMYAVGLVVKNRVESESYPNTYCSVVHQPKQFSYRNVGQPETNLVSLYTPDADRLWWSVTAAIDVSNGKIEDFTEGSLHYVNFDKIRFKPNWLQRMNVVVKIGSHSFLKRRGM